MKAFLLILLMSVLAVGQALEDGWRGIRPLKTNRTQVEKLLGRSTRNESGDYYYITDEAMIRVNYSTTPCKPDRLGRGDFRIPTNTVINYFVSFNRPIKLYDTGFDPHKYEKDLGGDVVNARSYRSVENGLTISVYLKDSIEYLNMLRFYPGEKKKNDFRCPDLKTKPHSE